MILLSLVCIKYFISKSNKYISENGKSSMGAVVEQIQQTYDLQVSGYYSQLQLVEEFLLRERELSLETDTNKSFFDAWEKESESTLIFLQENGQAISADGTRYMNASGIAIEAAAHFYKIPPERVLVLFDDISLPVGKLRIRKNGSAGGHNGLKSIISCLGSDQFPRVKIGVGAKPHPDYDLADWVLSTVSKTEWPDYQDAMEHAAEAALCIVKNGCEKAAAEYNGKRF